MITVGTVAAVTGVVLAAATLTRAVGFGFALMAVPLMAMVLPAKEAVVVVFLSGAVVSLWLAVHLRHHVDRRSARLLAAGAVAGAPAGVVFLRAVSPGALRVVLGVTVCSAAVWIIVSSRRTSQAPVPVRPTRTFSMGLASGVLSTSLATSGPPLVYELRRTGFTDDCFRATISAVFVVSSLIGLPLLGAAGLLTADATWLSLWSVPPSAAGIALGAWIGARMDTAQFLWAADLLLLATGLATLIRAFS